MSEKKKQEHLMGIWCEAFECICICDDKAHYYCCCLPSALLCAFVKNNCGYESVNWSAKKRNKNSHMEGKTKMRGKNNKKLNERKNDGESSAKDVLPCVFRNFVKRKSSSFFFVGDVLGIAVERALLRLGLMRSSSGTFDFIECRPGGPADRGTSSKCKIRMHAATGDRRRRRRHKV